MIDYERLLFYLKQQEKKIIKLSDIKNENKREALEKLLCIAEKQVVVIREYLSAISVSKPDKLLCYDSDFCEFNICIKPYTEGRYTITLPFLLPNRRTSTTYFKRSIADSLRSALKEFCDKNSVQPFEQASVTFVSYYSPSADRKMRHDNDNVEISVILNCLTGLMIPDDSSICCDLHLLSRDSDRSYTKIVVKSKEDS